MSYSGFTSSRNLDPAQTAVLRFPDTVLVVEGCRGSLFVRRLQELPPGQTLPVPANPKRATAGRS